MEHAYALRRIVVALGDTNICLKRCEIAAIPNIRSCAHGQGHTLIPSCFRCRRSTQLWLSFDRSALHSLLSKISRKTLIYSPPLDSCQLAWYSIFIMKIYQEGEAR